MKEDSIGEAGGVGRPWGCPPRREVWKAEAKVTSMHGVRGGRVYGYDDLMSLFPSQQQD